MLSRRVTAAAVVVAILVGLGVGLFVYSPADGASPTPFEETNPDGAYETTASLTTDGRTVNEQADPEADENGNDDGGRRDSSGEHGEMIGASVD